MKLAALTTLTYGFMVLTGGVVGYIQAKSMPSLINGIIFGIGLLICSKFIWQGSIPAGYISGGMTLLLALFFGYRFLSTNKFMPGGVMLIVSSLALVLLLLGLFLKSKT